MLLTTRNNNLFDTFFNDPWFNDPWFNDKDIRQAEKKLYGRHAKNLMLTDIRESDDGYELQMDLPGYKKEDINAKLENGYLIISAEKNLETKEDGSDEKKYIHKERYQGSCQRAFYVGEDLEQEDITASFKHGILTVQIPKKEEKPQVEEHKCITIEG